jgi:hypothetical protein
MISSNIDILYYDKRVSILSLIGNASLLRFDMNNCYL